jgi:hypothetical protein
LRSELHRWDHRDEAVRLTLDDADRANMTLPAVIANEVDDCLDSGRKLAVYGLAPQSGSHGERFNSCWNIVRRIRMNRAAPAVVAGIQGGQ